MMGSGVRTKLERAAETEEELWARGARSVLRSLRQDADVSQKELAALIGWTYREVVNLESGRKAVQVKHVAQVGRALGTEPEAAFGRIVYWIKSQVRGVGPAGLDLRKQAGNKPAALSGGRQPKNTLASGAPGRPKRT